MSSVMSGSQLTLYSSSVSDCSARLRIALNLKGIPHRLVSVNLAKQENLETAYTAVNPAKTVPTLVIECGNESFSLTQSLATIEYLEEAFPDTPRLLPSPGDVMLRAQVRNLTGIVANDIHPLTTHRVGRAIAAQFPGEEIDAAQASGMVEWDGYWIARGLEAYEEVVKDTCGKYSVGDSVTVADVALVPELWTATRIGVDLTQFPNVTRVYRNLSEIEGFSKEQSKLEQSKLEQSKLEQRLRS